MPVIHQSVMPEETAPDNQAFLAAITAGNAAHAAGDSARALAHYRAATEAAPTEAEGWLALGSLLLTLDQTVEATEALERAHAADPARRDIVITLSDCYLAARQTTAARTLLEKLDNGHPILLRQLARCAAAENNFRKAIALAQQSLTLASAETDFLLQMVDWHMAQADLFPALELLDQQARRRPDEPHLWQRLAQLWQQAGEIKQAAQAYQKYRALCPQAPTDMPAPLEKQAPWYQVKALFDAYAARFEPHLRERLDYRAPELLFDAVVAAAPGRRFSCVIDAGCGTGLMGVAIKPLADQLIGIDLSPRMLAQAEKKGVYDALVEGDLCTTMVQWAGGADLVLACDVLVYLGDLMPFFHTARLSLKSDGLLAVTAEASQHIDGFTRTAKNRTQHSRRYLETVAHDTGFNLVSVTSGILRQENNQPVTGWVMVVQPRL